MRAISSEPRHRYPHSYLSTHSHDVVDMLAATFLSDAKVVYGEIVCRYKIYIVSTSRNQKK